MCSITRDISLFNYFPLIVRRGVAAGSVGFFGVFGEQLLQRLRWLLDLTSLAASSLRGKSFCYFVSAFVITRLSGDPPKCCRSLISRFICSISSLMRFISPSKPPLKLLRPFLSSVALAHQCFNPSQREFGKFSGSSPAISNTLANLRRVQTQVG